MLSRMGLIDTGEHLEKLREENVLLMQTLQERATVEDPPVTLKTEIIQRTSATVAGHILDYIDAHDIDLIVMGMHGRKGPARLRMGSVAEAVVRETSRPTLVVKARLHTQQKKTATRDRQPQEMNT